MLSFLESIFESPISSRQTNLEELSVPEILMFKKSELVICSQFQRISSEEESDGEKVVKVRVYISIMSDIADLVKLGSGLSDKYCKLKSHLQSFTACFSPQV